MRLRMICQSWKVMFQAEYSSGSPLRMLVDLRASVEYALGRGKSPEAKENPAKPAEPAKRVKPAAVTAPANALAAKAGTAKPAALAAKAGVATGKPLAKLSPTTKPDTKAAAAPEFEVSSAPGWEQDSDSQAKK